MLNLLKLLLSIKVQFVRSSTIISYKALRVVVTDNHVSIQAAKDLDLDGGRDLLLNAGCYIGIDSTREEIESLLADDTKQTVKSNNKKLSY